MYYKFVWDKNKRKWHDKVLQVNDVTGLHYLVKELDEPVLEIYVDDIEDFTSYYCEYKETCLAVRGRPQGLLGVQTWTTDTRLSEHAKDAPLRLKYPNAPITNDLEAYWGGAESLYNLEELN